MKKYLILLLLPLLAGCNIQEDKMLGNNPLDTDANMISTKLQVVLGADVDKIFLPDFSYYLVSDQELTDFVMYLNHRNKQLGIENIGLEGMDCDNIAKIIDISADLLNKHVTEPAIGIIHVVNKERTYGHAANIVMMESGSIYIIDMQPQRQDFGNATVVRPVIEVISLSEFLEKYGDLVIRIDF